MRFDRKVYLAFHFILFLAFAFALLGFAVEGPSGYWSHTFQTRFGPMGIAKGILGGTTVLYGPDEFTIGFGLYAFLAFSVATVLFAVAGALGLRLTRQRHDNATS